MNIDDSTREKINKIAILLGLDLVVLHGSKATGVSISQESDVDIAVYRKAEKLSFKEEIDLISKFQQLFDEEVDVKQLNNKPLFFYEVMKDAKLLYGNQTIFDEMYLHAYKQFIDSKSLFELTKVMQNNRQKLLSQKYV